MNPRPFESQVQRFRAAVSVLVGPCCPALLNCMDVDVHSVVLLRKWNDDDDGHTVERLCVMFRWYRRRWSDNAGPSHNARRPQARWCHVEDLSQHHSEYVPVYLYRVGRKRKLLILSEYVNKTEKIGGMWTNTNRCRENVLSDIFTWNILHHKCFVLRYSMTESSQWNYAKFIKVCSIEYLTTEIELVLPTFKSWTVHKIMRYLTFGLLSSLWNIYHCTTAYFFDPPCIIITRWRRLRRQSRCQSVSL